MKRKVVWRMFAGLVYVALCYFIIDASISRFETLVLAILIQIYAAALYNFSILGRATDVNNYAGFVRFRILAAAQGISEDEGGLFVDQEKRLREALDTARILQIIDWTSHLLVSGYVIYKIIVVLFIS